jgi:hypothetical protein
MGGAMKLEEQMKKRRADLERRLLRVPRTNLHLNCSSRAADGVATRLIIFLSRYPPPSFNLDAHINVAKKIAIERLGHGIGKLQG